MINIAIDGHLHVYPSYDYARLLSSLHEALKTAVSNKMPTDEECATGALLAERRGCAFFRELDKGITGLKIHEKTDDFALVSGSGQDGMLYVFPGSQIVSNERIEILALAGTVDIPDGLPAEEIIKLVLENNAVPVLSWAPGKWLLKRGKVVAGLLNSFTQESFLIGDTSLRPNIWPVPALMRKAARLGFRIIAGSDPLPPAGEERFAGTYGFVMKNAFDKEHPGESVQHALKDKNTATEIIGQRSGLVDVFKRLRRHAASERTARTTESIRQTGKAKG